LCSASISNCRLPVDGQCHLEEIAPTISNVQADAAMLVTWQQQAELPASQWRSE
jgi:hypothetical protein